MIDRYVKFLGLEETKKMLQKNEQPLIPSIRTNTLKISALNLKKRMEEKGFELDPIEWIPYGFKVSKEAFNLGSSHEFLQGYYYLQNVASMLSAVILNPKSTDLVIDMCSAPGSKSTHLAQLMGNDGMLILIEKNPRRIPALEVNLRRMGIRNTLILNMDARNLSKSSFQGDKVLLDAPCTGEGLIRVDPKRKKSKKGKDLGKMSSVQKKLLIAGLRVVKPGGFLLYCTCSIAPEENELVVNEVLNKLDNFVISKIPKVYGIPGLTEVYGTNLREDLKFSQRLYPHIHDTIGFYFCLINNTT
jgi:NOL1/NOP2/sun family putative RNA methylase